MTRTNRERIDTFFCFSALSRHRETGADACRTAQVRGARARAFGGAKKHKTGKTEARGPANSAASRTSPTCKMMFSRLAQRTVGTHARYASNVAVLGAAGGIGRVAGAGYFVAGNRRELRARAALRILTRLAS